MTERMHVISRDGRGIPAWRAESKLTPEQRKELGIDKMPKAPPKEDTSFQGGRASPRRTSSKKGKK